MSRDFRPIFASIPSTLREALPADLRAFHWQASSWQAKAWYGNRELHYELWLRPRLRVIELGLHFESDALTNARLLGAFRGRAREVARALGTAARIERWDKGWTRVWEPIPLQDIDDAYGALIRERFVAYVRALEPILREELPSEVAWKLARPRPVARTKRPARGSSSRGSRSAR